MSKRAPSTAQLLVIAGFALSCFGILLFLWITFGGPTPFKARPYQINIPFKEATQLAQQSDVRISGVSVGKVQDIVLGPDGEQAMAKVHIEDKYGPIPKDTRAVLRTKTLLGETYIELTPGDRDGPVLEDGGTLANA
ncbi:MAG TPA: MlaD family protein, partial [Solirubrobacterales bacterium]|nr:MlaD family protein [Solirubrobacterales bacterium]